MKNIKAIIFDAYGTLFDVNSAAEKCKDKIGDKWEGFANYWRTTQLEYTWLRSLMKRHKDFWQVTEDSLDKSMKAFEIDYSMRNELLDLYKILSPFKEVPEVLKSLKEKDLKLITFQENDNGFNIFSNMNITPKSISYTGNLVGKDSLEFISYDYDLLINFFKSGDVLTLLSSKVNARFRVGFNSVDSRLNDLIFSNKMKKFKEFDSELIKYLKLIR